jgi:ATP-binding cassette subfamily B protein
MSSRGEIKKVFDFSLLKRILSYAKPYRRQLVLAIAMAVLIAVITPVRPMLVKLTVDDYIKPGSHALAAERAGMTEALIRISIFQIAFILLETFIRFYFSFITSWLGQHVVKDMRTAVYKKILHLNLRQFDKTPIGTLTTRTVNDIETINDVFADGFIPILSDLLSIIVILFTMFWIDWKMALICMLPFPFLLIATYYFKESVNRSFTRVRNAVASLNAFVQEHITGMGIVQAFAAEEREFGKFKKINKEHRNANIKAIFAYSVFFPVVEIVSAISIGLMAWWAAKEALHLSPELADKIPGTFTAFFLCINLLFRPLRVIADKFNVLQMGMVASERVFKVLDNEDYIRSEGNYSPQQVKGEVEFGQVWFAYDDEKFVLRDVSFTINAGETLAIVGHTGSGKTTIISLLNRLYPINKGSITIDGINIEDYSLDTLRSKIGVVLQDVFLFSGSVMDNITLRNPGITKEQVTEAARLIGVHDFIMRLPGGYDYNVMERGSTLSLGQRQLISFIRALLYHPSVLILDEATSSIDTESEQLIQKAIDTLIAGRTSIVIAHRLSTIRKAGKIIVLDKGEIKETGTHEELLDKKGVYYQLHKLQFQEQVANL